MNTQAILMMPNLCKTFSHILILNMVFIVSCLVPLVSLAGNCKDLRVELEKNGTMIHYSTFEVSRGFDLYTSAFKGTLLEGLTRSQQSPIYWIDLGAGDAIAMRDVMLGNTSVQPNFLWATAIGYENLRDFSGDLEKIAKRRGNGRFQYLSGRYFMEIPPKELRRADLITDYFGVLSYTSTVSQDLAKALGLLRTGGVLMMVYHPTGFAFEVSNGKAFTLNDYLATISGVKVIGDRENSSKDRDRVIEIQRTNGFLVVPQLEIVDFSSAAPPRRVFRIVSPNNAQAK